MRQTANALSQWSVWPPALAVVVLLVLGGWAVQRWLGQPWSWVYLLCLPLPGWWLLPRFAYRLWVAEGALYWRWGQGHLGRTGSLPLDQIASAEVLPLPDQPRRPYRTLAEGEVHGGSFNPGFNRGIKVVSTSGEVRWFGLPKPDEFAAALKAARPAESSASTQEQP
ncbi:hypothetical protein [Chitinimonas sp. BJYL2]|uniref:hypothetical protein n=1 Tax=Chitinimonas sp. BJYL2 TaxID=2976696 RepID=UPI0022B479F3|nr:hypothetical protein [Chitinimonas sp. BJYL2]